MYLDDLVSLHRSWKLLRKFRFPGNIITMLGFSDKTESRGITRLNNRDTRKQSWARTVSVYIQHLFIIHVCFFKIIKLFFLLCCVDSFYFHSEITYIVIPHETFCVIIHHNNNSNFLQVESRISSSFQFSFKSKVLFLLPPIRLSSFLPQQINKDLKRRKRKKIWVSKKKIYSMLFNPRSSHLLRSRIHA